MASVSASPRAVTAPPSSAPVVRHGTLRCQVLIGGTLYQVIPKQVPAECSVEISSITVLRKGDGTMYAVAFSGEEAHCTCPDHNRGHRCKHIGALTALGHIFAPAAAASVPAPPKAPRLLEEGWQPGGQYLTEEQVEIGTTLACAGSMSARQIDAAIRQAAPHTEAEIVAAIPVATPASRRSRRSAKARPVTYRGSK
jgi:hypothetical protein